MTAPEGFQILDSRSEVDAERWLRLWQAWPDREVFAHPAYGNLYAGSGDQSICASWSGPEGGVLFPLIVRPLRQEPWAREEGELSDLVSPYGYGGPYCWGSVDQEAYWASFDVWATTIGAVSCFVRLALFPDQLLPFRGEVAVERQNVVRPLVDEPDSIWMDYEHKVRKNVNRARQAGLGVEVDQDGTRLAAFLDVYIETMRRREAPRKYFFPKEFFTRMVRELRNQCVFFHVLEREEVIATELVLVSVDRAYSFLGGTRAEAFALRPNDLLKHTAFAWARRHGKASFVLGGGYEPEDGIFRYKRSFSPSGIVDFCVGRRVLDEDMYGKLVEKRAAFELRRGVAWQPAANYFPAYRCDVGGG